MTIYTALAGVILVALAAPQSKPQPSSADLIAALRSSDARTKAAAGRAISNRTDLHGDPTVKAAVLAELRDANEIMKRRRSTGTNIGSEPDFEYANVYLALVQAVQRFDGPDVLTALIPTLGNSASAQKRVSAFGVAAVEPLLAAYDEPIGIMSLESQRLSVLETLSQIVLQTNVPPPTRAKLRGLATEALSSPEPPEVAGGMLLGAALRDPGLIANIRQLRASGFPGVKETRSENYLEAFAKKAFERAGVR